MMITEVGRIFTELGQIVTSFDIDTPTLKMINFCFQR
jgi:hypothetical protein